MLHLIYSPAATKTEENEVYPLPAPSFLPQKCHGMWLPHLGAPELPKAVLSPPCVTPCALTLPALREVSLPWQLSALCQLSVAAGISILSSLLSRPCSCCAATDVWRDPAEPCARSQTSHEHFPAGPKSQWWEPFFKAPENEESPTQA